MSSEEPNAFIQARMNSSRYPGKSLAPLAGIPVIERVIERVNDAVPKSDVVVLTTRNRAENPLASHLEDQGVDVYRGHPTNVFRRFSSVLQQYPCSSFFRICGDSPFLEPTLFQKAKQIFSTDDYDIVTNVSPRDFPSGKSVELLDASTFQRVDEAELSKAQKEHVTKYFYDNQDQYDIMDIKHPESGASKESFAVDTLSDLKRLEEELERGTLDEQRHEVR